MVAGTIDSSNGQFKIFIMRSSPLVSAIFGLLVPTYPSAGRLSKPILAASSANPAAIRVHPGYVHGPDDWGRSPQCRRMARKNRLRRAGLGGDHI